MRYNTSALTSAITSKISKLCLHAIANEAFQKALPFDELTQEQSNKLSVFMLNALESIGGFGSLEKAIESTNGDYAKNKLLKDIKEACMEACRSTSARAIEAANDTQSEIIKSGDESKGISNTRIIESVNLNNQEYDKFMSSVSKLDVDGIAKAIGDQVIDTIKTEKAAYKAEDELKANIAEQLQESDFKDKDNALESFIDVQCGPTAQRTYTSLFSGIQEVCMESLNMRNIEKDEIYTDSALLAFNSVLGKPVSDSHLSMESLIDFTGEKDVVSMETLSSTGFVNAIVAYTALETLNTLNLLPLTTKDVKQFVDYRGKTSDSIKASLESVGAAVNKELQKYNAVVRTTNSKARLGEIKTALESLKENIEKLPDGAKRLSFESEGVLESIGVLNAKIDNKIKDTVATECGVRADNRFVQSDIGQLNKLNRVLLSDPAVESLGITFTAPGRATVSGLNKSGKVVRNDYINLDYKYAGESLTGTEYLKMIRPMSKLREDIHIDVKEGMKHTSL